MKPTLLKSVCQSIILLTTLLFLAKPNMATTAVMLEDEQLIVNSRIILIGEVRYIKPQWDNNHQNIFTYVKIDISQVLKGEVQNSYVVLKQLGGTIDEDSTIIFGTPRYQIGQRVLLFLNTWSDGTLRVAHLFQGKYDVVEDKQARHSYIERKVDSDKVNLLGVKESNKITNSASLKQFTKKIQTILASKSAKVVAYESKYKETPIVEIPPEYLDESEENPGSGRITPQFTFLGSGFRWFEPDFGIPVSYQINPSGAPLPSGGATQINQGLAAWTNVGTSSIVLQNIGFTSAVGFQADGVTAISYNDPLNQIDDPVGCSGVLAIGGISRASTQSTVINGKVFGRILEGDIVFNRFFECFLAIPANLAEVACHEIGHTIGFNHTIVPTAIMRAFAYGNGRGALLGLDDVTGVTFVYPQAGNPIDEARFFAGYLYRDFLNREPDFAGWDFWTSQLTLCGGEPNCVRGQRINVSTGFFTSTEFTSNKPALNPVFRGTPTYNQEFVLQCYRVYLRREPDPGGYNFWLSILQNNTPPGGLTPAAAYNIVLDGFLNSVEYRQRTFVRFGLNQ
ncbi:MAG: DUF4214 domain-containing protein [Acidobacteriota bacterium]